MTLRASGAQGVKNGLRLGNRLGVGIASDMIPPTPFGVQRVAHVNNRGIISDVSDACDVSAGGFGLHVQCRREFDDGTPVGRARWNVTNVQGI